MRELLKRTARGLAFVAALPWIVSFRLRKPLLGADRALEGSTQSLSLLPGLTGRYLRVAFLRQALAECHRTAAVEFGSTFSRTGARIGHNAYIGPGCRLGLVHIGPEVLLGAGVSVPSGSATHGTGRLDVPIREQIGELRVIRIGEGSWIGNAAVIMADVGCQTIVGAGAVVTHPLPDRVVSAGVPARIIKERHDNTPAKDDGLGPGRA